MSGICYIDGCYAPASEPLVLVEDRGYQFADGIYEVCLIVDGRCWDFDGHYTRMERSLRELSIDNPISKSALLVVMRELLLRNRLRDGLIYLQISRGVAPRNHPFPADAPAPTLVMTARRFDLAKSDALAANGARVVTTPDIRWSRVDIKSISLLPNILAKQLAAEHSAQEAWLFNEGGVTEGSSSNAWIVDADNALVTHPLGHEILGGITRQSVLACARELGLTVKERQFTVEEAKKAKEAFLTSATNLVTPIVEIDGDAVGNGNPGDIATRLRAAYKEFAFKNAPPILNTACK